MLTHLKIVHFLFFILFLQTKSLGQDIHEPVEVDSLNIFVVKLDSILKSGIDTFFVYRPYCENGYSGGYSVPRNATEKELRELECKYSKESYVFYRLMGNTFVTKVNECFSFTPIKINQSPSFLYFNLHFNDLLNDTVRDAAFIDLDGKKYYQGVDHSCYRVFYFAKTQKRYCWIDLYDFKKTLTEKHLNINYSHNMKTHLKLFMDIVSKEVDNLIFKRPDTPK